jgi:hypothetical protein
MPSFFRNIQLEATVLVSANHNISDEDVYALFHAAVCKAVKDAAASCPDVAAQGPYLAIKIRTGDEFEVASSPIEASVPYRQ